MDLPEPVGPVTSTAPYERRKPSSNITSPWLDMPSWSSPISAWVLSRIRMTTPSPSTWGIVTTRRSIEWPSTVSDTRPSCGTRFSEMSRLAMIFTREIVPGTIRRGMCVLSRSTPSTRKRTRMSRPSGSKWMSDAPSSTPWAMIEFTSLITGASSADSRTSVDLGELVLALLDGRGHRVVELAHAADQAVDVIDRAHHRQHLVAGHQLQVVEREHVRRVGHRHEQRAAVVEADRHGPEPASGRAG